MRLINFIFSLNVWIFKKDKHMLYTAAYNSDNKNYLNTKKSFVPLCVPLSHYTGGFP